MALWGKPLQFINVMLANRSPMSVAERGSDRMTYAKKKPFAAQDLRVTLHCAGDYGISGILETKIEKKKKASGDVSWQLHKWRPLQHKFGAVKKFNEKP